MTVNEAPARFAGLPRTPLHRRATTARVAVPRTNGKAQRVVVVGGGIAGMGAALGLAGRGVAVTLIDAEPVLGGACRAARATLPGYDPLSIDMGVCDFNRATFLRLAALLGEMCVPVQPVCQDASFRTSDGSWLWSSSLSGATFAPGVDGSFAREIERFKVEVGEVTEAHLSAGAWLSARGYSAEFRRLYFAPRARGCFPSPDVDPEALPVRSLARFWGMHGLVGPAPADRVCVRGGMHGYVPVLQARLQAMGVRLRLGEGVRCIEREPLRVHTEAVTIEADHLVLAVPPAVALRMLTRPSVVERAVLSSCRTQPGRVVLHRDPRLMPADPARWAAYNFVVADAETLHGPNITFFPERLAGLAALTGPLPPMFVTLNPPFEPREVLADKVLTHPVFGRDDTVSAALAALQGERSTWFCGAWTAEPYLHEQGLASGLAVAASI
jgi:predicted NAD/FAD-binding protein